MVGAAARGQRECTHKKAWPRRSGEWRARAATEARRGEKRGERACAQRAGGQARRGKSPFPCGRDAAARPSLCRHRDLHPPRPAGFESVTARARARAARCVPRGCKIVFCFRTRLFGGRERAAGAAPRRAAAQALSQGHRRARAQGALLSATLRRRRRQGRRPCAFAALKDYTLPLLLAAACCCCAAAVGEGAPPLVRRRRGRWAGGGHFGRGALLSTRPPCCRRRRRAG